MTASADSAMTELQRCLSGGVLKRSFVVAVIVGTILNLIGQGDVLLAGDPLNWWKIGLTYMVPFCVATYGAVSARRQWAKSLAEMESAGGSQGARGL